MATTSTSNTDFVEANIHSNFVLKTLPDSLLPTVFYRNVTDFTDGTTLDIPTIGTVTIQEVTENVPLDYKAIDSGTVNLTVTDYVGNAWYITDVARQDGRNMDMLVQAQSSETTRAMAEYFETQAFATLDSAQTSGAANNVNGFAHRFNASGDNDEIEIADFSSMRLSFDKANAPQGGRIAIVDPVVGASLEQKMQSNYSVNRNPSFQGMLETGFVSDHRFLFNLFGWDVYTSNRLPTSTETLTHWDGTGSSSITLGVANLFMCVGDDQVVPLMYASRQPVKTEGQRNMDNQRDEFLTTERYCLGAQRVDTLGVIKTDPSALD